jgi:hypothetical protein
MSRKRALVTTVGLALMIGIAACVLVGSANAQTGGAANQIVIQSQETNTGQIMVDTVIAAQDGWLVVYTDTNLSSRSMIGWAPIHKGVNTNLKVNIDSELAEPEATLWAVLYVDRGVIGQLELPLIDGPVQENGKTVMVAFGTQAPPAAAATPKAQAPARPPQTLPAAGASRSPTAGGMLVVLGSMMATAGVTLLHAKAWCASASQRVVR